MQRLSGRPSIVLFDGECGLCNSAVLFILANDRGRFRFLSLNSPKARILAAPYGGLPKGVDSVVVLDDAGVHVRSDGALAIALWLRFPWPLLGTAAWVLIPQRARNALYDWIAANRTAWFGRTACIVPTAEQRERFL